MTVLGGVLIGFGRLGWGAGVALVGSALDGLDGSVARAAGTESPRGALLDAMADRVGEVAVLSGLAAAVAGEQRLVILIVLARRRIDARPLSAGQGRGRGARRARGNDGQGGAGDSLLRSVLFSGLIEPMLWVLVIATWATVIWRFLLTYNNLR